MYQPGQAMQKKKQVITEDGEDPLTTMSTLKVVKNTNKDTFENKAKEQEQGQLSGDSQTTKQSGFVINKAIRVNLNTPTQESSSLLSGPKIGSKNPFGLLSGESADQQKQKGTNDVVFLKDQTNMQQNLSAANDSGLTNKKLAAGQNTKHKKEEDIVIAKSKAQPTEVEESKNSNGLLLPGEKLIATLPCTIIIMQYPHLSSPGTFFITNFKILFTPTSPGFLHKKPKLKDDYLWFPLGFILKFEKSTDKKSPEVTYIDIYSKDGRIFRLKLAEDPTNISARLIQYLHVYAFPEKKEHLFAFEYGKFCKDLEDKYKGWQVYDIQKEFERQGLDFSNQDDCPYRLADNQKFNICATYPSKLLVPSKLSDSTLIAASRFRTRERIPCVTYYYAKTKAILARSSQSKTGLVQNRCLEDEQLLRYLGNPLLNDIGDTGVNDVDLHIYDARPYLSAMATKFKGNGYEDTKWYRNCEIFFMDIDNIHHVRESHRKLLNLCFTPEISNAKWYSDLESTNWLELISFIIGAAKKISNSLKIGKSCLIHCSDGWDRTSQILALAQIMIDPYYRTIKGFEVLIMKEWVYFGHQFSIRLSHGNKNDKDDQRSPVFLQFLDCVQQLLNQYPFAFEFNEKFLSDIAYHTHSCQFGLFLCNSYQEILIRKLEEKTVCLWSYMNSQKEKYYNIHYYQNEDPNNPLILKPSNHLKHLRLWDEHFLNYSWLSRPQYEISQVIFPKDFYDYMFLKERIKVKELRSEVEELKAKLRKYEKEEEESKNNSVKEGSMQDIKDESQGEQNEKKAESSVNLNTNEERFICDLEEDTPQDSSGNKEGEDDSSYEKIQEVNKEDE